MQHRTSFNCSTPPMMHARLLALSPVHATGWRAIRAAFASHAIRYGPDRHHSFEGYYIFSMIACVGSLSPCRRGGNLLAESLNITIWKNRCFGANHRIMTACTQLRQPTAMFHDPHVCQPCLHNIRPRTQFGPLYHITQDQGTSQGFAICR